MPPRKGLNNWFKGTFGVTAAAMFVILAANGQNLVGSIRAFGLFVIELLSTAPLGFLSFLLALALAIVVQAPLTRWLPPMPCRTSREFVIESCSLAVGFGIMLAQMPTLMGGLLGLLIGFLAPYLFKGGAALVGLASRRSD